MLRSDKARFRKSYFLSQYYAGQIRGRPPILGFVGLGTLKSGLY